MDELCIVPGFRDVQLYFDAVRELQEKKELPHMKTVAHWVAVKGGPRWEGSCLKPLAQQVKQQHSKELADWGEPKDDGEVQTFVCKDVEKDFFDPKKAAWERGEEALWRRYFGEAEAATSEPGASEEGAAREPDDKDGGSQETPNPKASKTPPSPGSASDFFSKRFASQLEARWWLHENAPPDLRPADLKQAARLMHLFFTHKLLGFAVTKKQRAIVRYRDSDVAKEDAAAQQIWREKFFEAKQQRPSVGATQLWAEVHAQLRDDFLSDLGHFGPWLWARRNDKDIVRSFCRRPDDKQDASSATFLLRSEEFKRAWKAWKTERASNLGLKQAANECVFRERLYNVERFTDLFRALGRLEHCGTAECVVLDKQQSRSGTEMRQVKGARVWPLPELPSQSSRLQAELQAALRQFLQVALVR